MILNDVPCNLTISNTKYLSIWTIDQSTHIHGHLSPSNQALADEQSSSSSLGSCLNFGRWAKISYLPPLDHVYTREVSLHALKALSVQLLKSSWVASTKARVLGCYGTRCRMGAQVLGRWARLILEAKNARLLKSSRATNAWTNSARSL